MDRFLVNVDRDKRDESIELTREMVRMRTRLHQLKNHKASVVSDCDRFC